MNEQAVAVVCAIFSAICAILYGYYSRQGDIGALIMSSCFVAVVMLLSAYVLIMRYL